MLETCYVEHLLAEDTRSALRASHLERLANYLADIYLRWAVFFSVTKKVKAYASVFEAPGSIPLSYAKRS